MAPGILNRRGIDDLPELGLLDETGSQYDDASVESNSNLFFACCGKCSQCCCDCCCFNCPKKQQRLDKKDDDFVDARTNMDDNKNSLDSMFQTMDRRDFIMENIRIEHSMSSSRKVSGALSIQRHAMQPTELLVDIDDESVLSDTSSQEDITDVPEPLPDTPPTTSGGGGAPRTSSSSKNYQGFMRKCVTAISAASGLCKVEDAESRTADVLNSRCDICPYDFIDGDEICSSMNDKCVHKFHKECIIEWLMDHDHCPCCNEDFLVATKQDSDDDSVPSVRNIRVGGRDESDVFDPLERESSLWNVDQSVSLRKRSIRGLSNMDSVRF